MQLFAQRGGGSPDDDAMMAVMIVALVVLLAIALAIQILYLLTLSRCLRRCGEQNRAMEPGQVWLNLIPCFNIIWIFITVNRIADSLRDEFAERGLRGDGDFGRNLGITYNVMNLLGAIPYIGGIFSLIGFVCWIIYWVKIAGYSRQLLEDSEDRYNGYDDRDPDGDDRDPDRRDDAGRYDRDRDDR